MEWFRVLFYANRPPLVIPGCIPQLYNGYYIYTGGHIHDDASHQIPSNGFFGQLTTQSNGGTGLRVKFRASRTGEREWIDACSATCTTTDAIVRDTSLELVYNGGNHTLIGDTTWHPMNHWATRSTIDALMSITQAYANAFSSVTGYQIVGVNDISIEYGGVFDICVPQAGCKDDFGLPLVSPWGSPHIRHDKGKAIDFRANSLPNAILPAAYESFTGPQGGAGGTGGWCRQFGLSSFVRLESVGRPNQHVHCDGN